MVKSADNALRIILFLNKRLPFLIYSLSRNGIKINTCLAQC